MQITADCYLTITLTFCFGSRRPKQRLKKGPAMGAVYFLQPSVPSRPKEGEEGAGSLELEAFLPLLGPILASFATLVRPLTNCGANEHFPSVYMHFGACVYFVGADSLKSLQH